jgi:hypothetical protein
MNRRNLLLVLPLTGCVGASLPLQGDTAFIAPNTRFRIPPPSLLHQTVAVAQTVQADYGGVGKVFEAQIAITPEGLDLVALDGLGRRALTISWHGHDPHAEVAPWLPEGVSPANMLADIALLYWPEVVLRPALLAAGARLEATSSRRTIYAGGSEVIRIDYARPGWGGQALLRNLAFGYSLSVNSVLLAP